MGVIVKPLNLNDRQVKRVDRIEESNGTYEGRARRVANRIDARRDARGAENPRLAKMLGAKPAMAQPMKKGGKIIKKAQNGIVKSLKKAGADLKQADRDYKSSDSVRNLPIKSKSLKGKLDEMKGNRAKADSLFKVAQKREMGQMKKGGKMIKKAQNGKFLKALTAQKGDTSRKMGLNFDKKSFDSLPKLKTKAKNGTSFGMLSVKAGVDKNPKPTAADRIAGAKGLAKYGKMMKKGGKCKNGC